MAMEDDKLAPLLSPPLKIIHENDDCHDDSTCLASPPMKEMFSFAERLQQQVAALKEEGKSLKSKQRHKQKVYIGPICRKATTASGCPQKRGGIIEIEARCR